MALSRGRGTGRSATPTINVLLLFVCFHLTCLVYYDLTSFLVLLFPLRRSLLRETHPVLSLFPSGLYCYFTLVMSIPTFVIRCFSARVVIFWFRIWLCELRGSPIQSTCLLYEFGRLD
jgi:hypothetical protein